MLLIQLQAKTEFLADLALCIGIQVAQRCGLGQDCNR